MKKEEKGFWEKANDAIPRLPDVRKPVSQAIDKLQNSVRHIIDLMVVFLLQTVVIPVGFLWVLVALTRGVPTAIRT